LVLFLGNAGQIKLFAQESSDDTLNALLQQTQSESAETESDEEEAADDEKEESKEKPQEEKKEEKPEKEKPVSAGRPAIHKNSEHLSTDGEEFDPKDYEDEVTKEDDQSDILLEITKPKSLTEKILPEKELIEKRSATDGFSSTKPEEDKKSDETKTPPPSEKIIKQPETTPEKPKEKEPIAQPLDPMLSVGCPFAPQMLKVLYDDMMNGLSGRNVMGRFNTWRGYMGATLNNTRSQTTRTEVNGRARLSWYEHLYRNPLESVFETEEFSRIMHIKLSSNNSQQYAEAMTMLRAKLDIPKREDDGVQFAKVDTPEQAMQEVVRAITAAKTLHARAVSPLIASEKNMINTRLYNSLCGAESSGHSFYGAGNNVAVQMLSLILKTDRRAMQDAAEALLPLTDDRLLAQLKQLNPSQFQPVSLDGQNIYQYVTPAGTILIGGRENNTYNLDGFRGSEDIVCVIDLGGNDTYKEGVCGGNRPVFVILDLEGDDNYIATKPGVQGGSLLGVSLLVDCAGNDNYRANDVAQGSSIGGVGMLIDKGGNDRYWGVRRVQGQAFGGMGILIDQKGIDDYHAAMWAQGFGHSAGLGVLEDVDGDDHYYLGGLYLDSYPEHPGYEGWGQGLGAGFRGANGSACGGIGMLLEGGGNDRYEFDYIAHGGGYWLGVGMFRDFGGNDKHIGSTALDFYGNPRREAQWQRFCSGFGCHYSAGYFFDDGGDDLYEGTIMGCGMAWDLSFAFHSDFGGNDIYKARGGLMQGVGANGSLGVLLNYFGNDTYMGGSPGYANPTCDPKYHDTIQCGGNFSFLCDYGGTDNYGVRVRNNSYNQRGAASGFLIDRPLETEPQEEPKPVVQPQQRPQQPQRQQQPPRTTTPARRRI